MPAKKKTAAAKKKPVTRKKTSAKKRPATTVAFDPSAAAAPGTGIFGLSQDRKSAAVHLIPVPFEATTSYGGGTAKGPRAMVAASHQIDLYDLDNGNPWEAGIFMLPEAAAIKKLNAAAKPRAQRVVKAGGPGTSKSLQRDCDLVNQSCEKLNGLVRAAAKKALDAGKLVGLVGGDHGTPFGLIEELVFRHPGLGILHFDAHHDLRPAYEGFVWSHASIMHNVMTRLSNVERLVQVGIRDFSEEEAAFVRDSDRHVIAHYDQELRRAQFEGVSFNHVAEAIVRELPDEVYVSFDVDGLDPKLCPNTGTPVPGGLQFAEAIHILDLVVRSGRRIVGFDLVEVAPGKDEWDAAVGARLLYK
ncbi:MAG: agmatinase family protein, partial [Planctomycetes bacterium]|nr:agmatinase family protein [Planctomycetota bacterium]